MSQTIIPELEELRQKISSVDEEILSLIHQRIELARRVGGVKLAMGLPVKDYRVEREVVERNSTKAKNIGLYEELGREVSQLLIKYSVAAQDAFQQQSRASSSGTVKRILIIGGAGRMGQWCANYFASFGHEISIFDVARKLTSQEPQHFSHVSELAPASLQADIIVIAAPIPTIAGILNELSDVATEALIFDIASLKSPFLKAIEAARARGRRVTSIHPMFGPGVELLAGRNILLCDTGDGGLVDEAHALFRDTSAKIVRLAIGEHDRLMSYVLGLSHLINLVFVEAMRLGAYPFSSLQAVGSTTFLAQMAVAGPVSAENQELYHSIQRANEFTPAVIASLEEALRRYGKAVAVDQPAAFTSLMEEGRKYLSEQPKAGPSS